MSARLPSQLMSLTALAAICAFPSAAIAQDEDEARDEITVTAQRREENLQDVPVSITAISEAELSTKQIRDVNDLQAYAPNVFISTGTGTASSARIFFRGVGEDESRGAIDPAVGIYIDGVYLGRTVGSLLDVVDAERIEVLRGPQGTLYGRNTNGGAIKLISKQPALEDSATMDIGLGSDSRVSARGVFNVGLADSTALRIAALYKERDGYHQLRPNGALAGLAREVGQEEVLSLRGSLRQDFGSDWSATLAVDFTDDDTDPTPSSIIAESSFPVVIQDADNNIFTVEPQPGVVCSAATAITLRPVGCFDRFASEVEIFGASLNVNGRLGSVDLASITSWRSMEDSLSTHISLPFFQNTDQEQFSQEITLTTDFDGPFNALAGFYLYNEDVRLDSTFVSMFRVAVDTKSYALFGQAFIDITDELRVTGGLRYTDEARDFIGENLTNRAAAAPFSPGSRVAELNTENVNYTAKIDYDLTDDVMIYGSFSTGFKSPGFSPDCFGALACFLPVAEENLRSWEGGLRAQGFDGRVTFNATYFYNKYEDLQISATVPGLGFTRSNAASARIQGVEIEATVAPIKNLEFFGNFGWLDAKYRDLTLAQAGTLTNNGASCGGAAFLTIQCALGLELKNAPEIKATLGALWTLNAMGGEFQVGGDMAYEDESFALVANNPGSIVDPGVTYNARIAYRPDDGPWRIAIWGKNLGDREYFRATTALNHVYAMPPRTWGVDLGFDF